MLCEWCDDKIIDAWVQIHSLVIHREISLKLDMRIIYLLSIFKGFDLSLVSTLLIQAPILYPYTGLQYGCNTYNPKHQSHHFCTEVLSERKILKNTFKYDPKWNITFSNSLLKIALIEKMPRTAFVVFTWTQSRTVTQKRGGGIPPL